MAQTDDPNFAQVRIRMKKTLHQQLERAADERGASMNAEIVDRLERSFQIDRIIGGPIVEDRALLGIVRMIAAAMHDTGRSAAFSSTFSPEQTAAWIEVPYAYDQAVQAALTILEAFRPPGKIEPPRARMPAGTELDLGEVYKHIGRGFANSILEQVARGATRVSGGEEMIARIRDDLGSLRDRIMRFAVGGQTTTREVWGGKRSQKKGGKK